MTSSRPYLIRGIYEWLINNGKTPYILVDASTPMVKVPKQHVTDGKIVLNIEANAVANLDLGNTTIQFDARFSGASHHISIPVYAVKAIYAFENGRGMVFGEEDDGGDGEGQMSTTPTSTKKKSAPKDKISRPSLKIVK